MHHNRNGGDYHRDEKSDNSAYKLTESIQKLRATTAYVPDGLHGLSPGPFLRSYSVFLLVPFLYFPRFCCRALN